MSDLPNTAVLRHIVDVHCHPTDAPDGISSNSMQHLDITVCAMSTMQTDQALVKQLATAYPEKVVPCFGYHPWFSHLISTTSNPISKDEHYRSLFLPSSIGNAAADATDSEETNSLEAQFATLIAHLPDPRPLSEVLTELRQNLSDFPTSMLGEVGLDRVFRVPLDYFASPRHLTAFTIPLAHQVAILEAQMEVAVELGKNISLHSVKSQQATLDSLGRMKKKFGEKWNRISLDIHSCGFNPQTWRDIERKHENVFLSLSTVINHRHPNHRALIAGCSPNRLLVESDYNDVDMCTKQTWDMIRIIAEVRGWDIETEWVDELEEDKWGVVRRLEQNWLRFKEGHHSMPKTRKNRRKENDFVYDSDVQQD
ncbi:TatD DNase family Scn1 [Phlegmacium glaucopus]|nr:TatD DNase family Scn1 [Phlegmacium glaucopus]